MNFEEYLLLTTSNFSTDTSAFGGTNGSENDSFSVPILPSFIEQAPPPQPPGPNPPNPDQETEQLNHLWQSAMTLVSAYDQKESSLFQELESSLSHSVSKFDQAIAACRSPHASPSKPGTAKGSPLSSHTSPAMLLASHFSSPPHSALVGGAQPNFSFGGVVLDQRAALKRKIEETMGEIAASAGSRKKRDFLPEHATAILRMWLVEHFSRPYPDDEEKSALSIQTGLTRTQIDNWFINARKRIWQPLYESIYVTNAASASSQPSPQTVGLSNGGQSLLTANPFSQPPAAAPAISVSQPPTTTTTTGDLQDPARKTLVPPHIRAKTELQQLLLTKVFEAATVGDSPSGTKLGSPAPMSAEPTTTLPSFLHHVQNQPIGGPQSFWSSHFPAHAPAPAQQTAAAFPQQSFPALVGNAKHEQPMNTLVQPFAANSLSLPQPIYNPTTLANSSLPSSSVIGGQFSQPSQAYAPPSIFSIPLPQGPTNQHQPTYSFLEPLPLSLDFSSFGVTATAGADGTMLNGTGDMGGLPSFGTDSMQPVPTPLSARTEMFLNDIFDIK